MNKRIHVMDSGAFTWFTQRRKNHTGGKRNWSSYRTKEFWQYVDDYSDFIKKWKHAIDHYVTVDAVGNPEISWEVQKYMEEEHGLNPIPVIHFGTGVEWLEKYLNKGYDYIGMGGRIGRQSYFPWADKMWNVICSGKDHLPVCKVHAFAVTTHKHMTRYPWYTCDSTTWKKMSYYSQILTPRKINGEFSWEYPNLVIFMDYNSPYMKRGPRSRGKHFLHMPKPQQTYVREWLEYIGVPFGTYKPSGTIDTVGVTNCKQERVAATIKYFLWLQSKVPKWPWPFQVHERSNLDDFIKG